MDSQTKTVRQHVPRVAFRRSSVSVCQSRDIDTIQRGIDAFFGAVGSPIAISYSQKPHRSISTDSVDNLQLDGAIHAKIPHFLSSWFQSGTSPQAGRLSSANAVLQPPKNSQAIRYEELQVGRKIGEGAFGKVFRGKWSGRAVAIKVLVCQDLRSDIMAEFQSEVEIMSILRHPNICRLLGACMEPPNRAIVVELCQGGSLWNVLRLKRHSLTPKMRTKFLLDTAKGMSYLHHFKQPILHRDLKSPNLLVDSDYTIKISDFGLARVKAHVQTMTGNCGTVQWMAPEVLGNLKYTEKADVFSFGIVVWEVMTGECPYEGLSQVQAALGVLSRNLRPGIPKNCPPFFQRLMRSCWDRQADLRPSFSQIIVALSEAMDS
uniref:non-specific serine/threonine protein kinase n=1 Tax=Albugo laibachii Nc14 TaxID=890382 RepID=F0W647_9STRA|nr:protein kinase putative [Albugo laibachii Nc14]|eukprot:CCA16589.1 protein kinase putative [Albugo laibachii Nc14]